MLSNLFVSRDFFLKYFAKERKRENIIKMTHIFFGRRVKYESILKLLKEIRESP